jgi:hypothetical protein
LRALVGERSRQEHVFLNRCGQPTTRFGVHALVERTAARAKDLMPSLAMKRVSPHSIRHYLPFLTMSREGRARTGMTQLWLLRRAAAAR